MGYKGRIYRRFKREDWESPDDPTPNTLSEREKEIVQREIKSGASESALAAYFNTTVREIRAAVTQGRIMDERDERKEN